MPVHFGLPDKKPVDVEITTLTKNGRKTAVLFNVSPDGSVLTVKVDKNGQILK